MNKFLLWLKALRAPFFQAAAIPVIVGTSVAFWHGKFSSLFFFILALVGNVSLNAAVNLINDYFDRPSDNINPQPTPFSGGSRIIQEGLLPAKAFLKGAIIAYLVSLVIGIYLIYHTGPILLYIVLVGFILNYSYTAPPLFLDYHGLGELVVFLCLGPLAVLGAYYVQARTLSWEALLVSIPVGLLVGGILYINEFPDYEPDKAAKKNHLVVLLGKEKAVKGYILLLALIYLSILIAMGLKAVPILALLTLLTLPIAIKTGKTALQHYADANVMTLIPAMAGQIQLHLLIGLLLSLSCIFGRLLLPILP